MLVFCEGQLKAGGQREQIGRQKKRPHQDLLVPGNHFLPGAYFKTEKIEQENGELTGLEVTEYVSCSFCQLYSAGVQGILHLSVLLYGTVSHVPMK